MTLHQIKLPEMTPVLLAEVRDFLKVSHGDEDVLITALIRAAAEVCENFIGRKLIAQQWQMILNDWEADIIPLPLSPVMTVDRVEVWSEGSFLDVAPENYLLDQTSYQPRLVVAQAGSWPDPTRDVGGIKITFTAGFGPSQNEVPHDIRLGLLHWIAATYDDGGQGADQLLHMAERLWQPYRRVKL